MNGVDHTFDITPDVAWDDIRLCDDCGDADMVCFGSLAQRSAGNRVALKRILERNPRAFVVCDINLRGSHYTGDVLDTSFAAADFLKLSLDEVSTVAALFQLTDTLPGFCGALMNAYQRLSHIAVTGGSAGAWLYQRSGHLLHQPAPPVVVVDTVGCGDAFTAMLAGSLLSGAEDGAALREAVQYASRVAGVRGALMGAE
jgi:fructokinase